MKKIITLLVFASAVTLAQAQSKIGANPTKSDPDAKKILDAVSAKFKSFKAPQDTFTYKVENGDGKVLSSKSGSVVMKGNKYKVAMNGQEIFSNGTTVWTYDKNANEVTITSLDGGANSVTPQKLFTNFYDKDFYYKLNGTSKQGGKTVQEIELTPVDKSRPFHKVYVWVDKANNTIYSTTVLEKSGNRYTYTVTKLNPNAAVSDASFVFDKSKYPGVEVVDLR